RHGDNVFGLIIRGVFLARRRDLDWFVNDGARRIYPERWERLSECIPKAYHRDPVKGLCRALWSDNELGRMRTALEWNAWSNQVALGDAYREDDQEHATLKMLARVRMELHYAEHGYFIEENEILKNCNLLRHIPTVIIHGRNDLVCPAEAGLSLYKALPEAEFILLPDAGHIAQGESMIDALVTATDKMAEKWITEV
ncbi:MAG: alpha/beta fold hydrolase, partial [Gammaproteobacteria bacterium]